MTEFDDIPYLKLNMLAIETQRSSENLKSGFSDDLFFCLL
jgi:hypothetical protein